MYVEYRKSYFWCLCMVVCRLGNHNPQSIYISQKHHSEFFLSTISLVFQLFEINRRVILGDYAAIEDTIRAILIASVVLVSVTIILNLVALVKAKNK